MSKPCSSRPPLAEGPGNGELRRVAHRRLDELFDQMEREEAHGLVSLEVAFERGRVRQVRRVLNSTDRPCV